MADLILILIVLLFVFFGARRGLVKTLMGMMSTVLSLVISMIIYSPVSKMLYESSIGDNIKLFVRDFMEQRMGDGAKYILTDTLVETSSMLVTNIISFIVVIIISKIAIILISNLLKLATMLPVIKQADMLLGGIVGALSGILVCYIIVGVIKGIAPQGYITTIKESIESSYLAIFLYEKNLVGEILTTINK